VPWSIARDKRVSWFKGSSSSISVSAKSSTQVTSRSLGAVFNRRIIGVRLVLLISLAWNSKVDNCGIESSAMSREYMGGQ
jgi:hypothetical protein